MAGWESNVLTSMMVLLLDQAKQAFKSASREGGSFAPYMLTKHADTENNKDHGKSSIGWLGGFLNACPLGQIKLGRDCEKEVLDDMVEVKELEIPQSFKDFVDKQ
jgi:hypothetical protein